MTKFTDRWLVLCAWSRRACFTVLPALKDTEALADDLMRYVFAGIDALTKGAKAPAPTASKAGMRR